MANKMADKFKAFIKKLEWQDYAFIIVFIVYLILIINLLSGFKQLPSPVFGGDYYYSLGSVQHVMSGGNILESGNVLGADPVYLPMYSVLVSIVAGILGLSAFSAVQVFGILALIAALIIFYFFANSLFKNKSLSLIALMLYMPLVLFPVWKYKQLTILIIIPLFLWAMLAFYRKRNLLSAALAGITFGLMGISHTAGFVVAIFFFIVFALYILFFEFLNKKDKKWVFDKEDFKKKLFSSIKFLFIIGIIGSLIAMIHWFKPIFVYHGQLPNQFRVIMDLSAFNLQLKLLWDTFRLYFFDFSSIFRGLKAVLFIIGFLSIFFLRKYDESKKFLILILITTFVGSFHYFLTQPLLGMNLAAEHVSWFTFDITSALFAALAIGLIVGLISGFAKKFKKYIFMGFVILILVLNITFFLGKMSKDQWINTGRTEMAANLLAMQDWVLKNTDVNDVFLSTNELSFALNGLTGRKEVIGRQAHNSIYLDTDERQGAAAIMLYGNDNQERKRLLKEYSVDYLYWDYYWMQSEWSFDNQGKMTSWFDPIVLIDTPENNELITKYNISFFKQHTWLDPSVRTPYVKKLDLIFILPWQFNLTHPWHPDLDIYLEEVWTYKQNDAVFSRIYKVVNID